MKLGQKLGLAFVVTSLMTAITAVIGYSGMSNLESDFSRVNDLSAVVSDVQTLRQAEKDYVITADDRFISQADELDEQLLQRINNLAEKSDSAGVDARMTRIREQLATYLRQFRAYADQRRRLEALGGGMEQTAAALEALLVDVRTEQQAQYEALNNKLFASKADFKARLDKVDTANLMMKRMLEARTEEKNFIIYEDPEALARARTLAEDIIASADALEASSPDSGSRAEPSASDEAQAAAASAAAEKVRALAQDYIDALDGYLDTWQVAGQALAAMTASAATMQALAVEESQLVLDAIDDDLDQKISLLLIAALVAIAIAVLAGYTVSRYITRAVDALLESMKRVANGDLQVSLKSQSKDELGQLSLAANKMVERLKALLGTIRETGSELKGSAETINQIGEENAGAIDQQRSEISHVATAINEMTSSIQEVSNSVSQTDTSTKQADQLAVQGQQANQAVSKAVEALELNMQAIIKSIESLKGESEHIGQVLDVIRTIADQTNLLALNAAIEAARAGEHGRGFAVVADEVRTLARRTQGSTDEIEKMIATLRTSIASAVGVINESESGLKSVVVAKDTAETTINDIKQSLTAIAEMMTQVASATEEQGNVSEEISSNITSIDDSAEKTSHRAARASESSQSLVRIARRLDEQLNEFKL